MTSLKTFREERLFDSRSPRNFRSLLSRLFPMCGDDENGFPQSTVQDIEVYKGDFHQPLQHLTGCDFDQMQPPQRYGDWFHTDDINFDGYQDIYLKTIWEAPGITMAAYGSITPRLASSITVRRSANSPDTGSTHQAKPFVLLKEPVWPDRSISQTNTR